MQKTEKNFNTVKVEESSGMVIMHDITRIVPGRFKGPAFKKGHIIREEDIPVLKDLGKEHIYAFEIPADFYHEDDAARLFKKIAGRNVVCQGPSEGKIVFSAGLSGMVFIKADAVDKINEIGDIALTTIHSSLPVRSGDEIAGIRALPLVIEKKKVEKALSYSSDPVLEVIPFQKKKIALIVTGSEISSGRIKDAFRPVIEEKASGYGSSVSFFSTPGDDPEIIKRDIHRAVSAGCGFIIVTGGMSVDPDDMTSRAIEDAGVEMVSRGAPVLPGNMLLVGYRDDIPVLGVPACALYSDVTALDLFLPFIFSGVKITPNDVLNKGYGGFCRKCGTCVFPRCALGK